MNDTETKPIENSPIESTSRSINAFDNLADHNLKDNLKKQVDSIIFQNKWYLDMAKRTLYNKIDQLANDDIHNYCVEVIYPNRDQFLNLYDIKLFNANESSNGDNSSISNGIILNSNTSNNINFNGNASDNISFNGSTSTTRDFNSHSSNVGLINRNLSNGNPFDSDSLCNNTSSTDNLLNLDQLNDNNSSDDDNHLINCYLNNTNLVNGCQSIDKNTQLLINLLNENKSKEKSFITNESLLNLLNVNQLSKTDNIDEPIRISTPLEDQQFQSNNSIDSLISTHPTNASNNDLNFNSIPKSPTDATSESNGSRKRKFNTVSFDNLFNHIDQDSIDENGYLMYDKNVIKKEPLIIFSGKKLYLCQNCPFTTFNTTILKNHFNYHKLTFDHHKEDR